MYCELKMNVGLVVVMIEYLEIGLIVGMEMWMIHVWNGFGLLKFYCNCLNEDGYCNEIVFWMELDVYECWNLNGLMENGEMVLFKMK